jgi:hypothetical protein
MLENILGNIELRKLIPKQKITQSKKTRFEFYG